MKEPLKGLGEANQKHSSDAKARSMSLQESIENSLSIKILIYDYSLHRIL